MVVCGCAAGTVLDLDVRLPVRYRANIQREAPTYYQRCCDQQLQGDDSPHGSRCSHDRFRLIGASWGVKLHLGSRSWTLVSLRVETS
jgi:hypothetical protein